MTVEAKIGDSNIPSPSDLTEMLGYREGEDEPAETTEATPLDVDWHEAISTRAYDFIVGWETGGRAYYEQVIKARPCWPEFASGITIGCGYDLGYHSVGQFRADWSGRIPASAIERLLGAIGFRTVDPGRSAKVARARQLVQSFQDIVIPWDIAIAQFNESKLPKLVADLYGALDHLDRLHPHCRGALLSLVFNRGAGGFTLPADRYKEMREIKRLMTVGNAASFAEIPNQFRSMARIWGPGSSLAKRRRQEAELFEAGLAESGLMEAVQAFGNEAELESVSSLILEDHSDVEYPSDQDEEDLDFTESVLESIGPTREDVRWNPSDDEQPDYRHLPKPSDAIEFQLTVDDLATLVKFNAFDPLPGKMVFALRGCRIVGADKAENVATISLADQRPDHRSYRCVIGVLDPQAKRMWAYRASTVPEANALLLCYQRAKAGAPLEGNILPTGCYTYTVGTHRAGTSHEIRGVLRLATTADGASVVTALRSINDVIYDRRDLWDKCAPADNIHPGRRTNGFSSLGCMTLPGNYDVNDHTHSGLWADFRVALGMGRTFAPSDNGRQFSTILLTGLDAALASRFRSQGGLASPDARNALLRIRFGSKGEQVARLQQQLGLAPDSSQLVGPITRGALIKLQQKKLGWADGILSPDIERDLGLAVLN